MYTAVVNDVDGDLEVLQQYCITMCHFFMTDTHMDMKYTSLTQSLMKAFVNLVQKPCQVQ